MNERRWDKIRKIEDNYNKKLFGQMSAQESLNIFMQIYEFGSKLAGKRHMNSVDSDHIGNIVAVKRKLRLLSR